MKIYTAAKETGEHIEECKSIEEALELIANYEKMKGNNVEVVEDETCRVIYR